MSTFPHPPRWADALLERCCRPACLEEIQGDLHELFARRVRTHGVLLARLVYWWDLLWFCRPALLPRSRPDYDHAGGLAMWKNYLTVALRTLRKQSFYALLNIVGLALGLAVCLLIFLFVQDELRYDDHFAKADRIYRIGGIFEAQQVHSEEARIAYPAAELLQADFPEVETAVRLVTVGERTLFARDDRRFYEDHFFLTDSTFFDVFDVPLLRGDAATALTAPNSLVLTASTARKYFGEADPLGQTLLFDNREPLTVTGVMADLPHTTHLALDLVASQTSLPALYGEGILDGLQQWGWPSTYTYIVLSEGYDADQLRAKLPAFEARNDVQDALDLHLQPLTDIHLHSHLELEMQPNGDIRTVWTFSAIALLILLIACINFMNLATARAALRAREVGLRKVVGALRPQLIAQFLGEALLLTLAALGLALVLVHLALPWFNDFVGKDLAMGYLDNPLVPLGLLALALVVGTGAGAYPAFYLSRAQPMAVLRGQTTTGRGSGLVRKVLVVTQFAISIALLAATGVVFAQMRYAQTMDPGYDREQIVVVDGLQRVGEVEAYETLRDRLLQHAAIRNVTSAGLIPTDNLFSGTGFRRPGQAAEEPLFFRVNPVDVDYFDTFDIQIVAGRGFSRDFPGDRRTFPTEETPHTRASIILNEAAVAKAGWASPEEAIGQTLIQGGVDESITYTIVGVARDIHFASLHYAIEPLVYFIDPRVLDQLAIQIGTADLAATLEHIDATWNEVVPAYPIVRSFLDDRFDALYRQEQRSATVLTLFAGFAVLIACLGLLGLAAFLAEQRRREIGVRKVLGASVRDIVVMLSWDFSKLVLLANLIAWPVAYVAMRQWLADFAYRVDIGWYLFLGAGLLAFVIAMLTVGWHAGRAALMNPVAAIRDAG